MTDALEAAGEWLWQALRDIPAVLRDFVSGLEDLLGDLTAVDWLLVIGGLASLWQAVVLVRSTRGIEAVEVAELQSDSEAIAAKALSARLRQKLAGKGLLPPPEVPAGAPASGLLAAVEASPVPSAAWLGKLLALLPFTRRGGYKLSGTAVSDSRGTARVLFTLVAARGGRVVASATVEGSDVEGAIDAVATEVYIAIVQRERTVYPVWARWRDRQALANYEKALAFEAASQPEHASACYAAATEREPRNALPRLLRANLLERLGTKGPADEKRVLALEGYLRVVDLAPSLVQARYRAGVELGRFAETLPAQDLPRLRRLVGASENVKDDRLKKLLDTKAKSETKAAMGHLRPFYVLRRYGRLRYRFELQGRERRQFRHAARLSLLCGQALRARKRTRRLWLRLRLRADLFGRWSVVGWQAHYNAACFYALQPDDKLVDRAFKHLDRAIRDPGSRLACEWLDADPDLQRLRGRGGAWRQRRAALCGPTDVPAGEAEECAGPRAEEAQANAKRKFSLRGRDAGSGRFIPIKLARRRKKTAVVERIPLARRPRKR